MAKRCALSGKTIQTGNNVSHANNRTRRRFLPNLQATSVWSDALDRSVRLRLTAYALRLVEKKGGLDAYLLSTRDTKLQPEFRRIKKQVVKAVERKAA